MRVHTIQTGAVRIKQAQVESPSPGALGRLGILMDSHWSPWLPTYAWAIEHDEGVIVVDTGQSAYLADEIRTTLHPYVRLEVDVRLEREQEVGPQLRSIGIGPRDVRKVVLTHLHMDHDAGLAHFPHSEFLVAPGELAGARGWVGRLRGYLPHRWPESFDPTTLNLTDGLFGPFARSKRLTASGDVVAVATPGHTPHHLSVIVRDSDADIFLAGDTSYTEALMLAGKVDGVSADAKVAAATLATIRQHAAAHPTIYLPTHDPDSAARLAARQTVVVPPDAKVAA